MDLGHPERLNGDCARSSSGENKTKVASGRHECVLIWRLRLVLQLAIWEAIILSFNLGNNHVKF